MKKFWLIVVSLLFLASMIIYAAVRAKTEESDFGAGEEIARVCVDGRCKNLGKTDYRTLKDRYKDKINKNESFTYEEYKELIQIVDLETKKNKIVLDKVQSKDLAIEVVKEALK